MKRLLFDEYVPRRLRRQLAEYEVRTVQEEGWSGLTNGQLLQAAQDKFVALLTADKRLQFQLNIAAFRIAVVVISLASIAPSNLANVIGRIKSAIEQAQPGSVVVVAAG